MILGVGASILVMVDGLWPAGQLFAVYRRAGASVRRLQAKANSEWRQAQLLNTTDAPAVTEAAARIIGMISDERERIDREVVGKQESLDEIFQRFRNKETDILVGTQMLTKGLDFEHLTLVGVLQADSHLQLPDFKAAERTYQVLEQVAWGCIDVGEPGHQLHNVFARQIAERGLQQWAICIEKIGILEYALLL